MTKKRQQAQQIYWFSAGNGPEHAKRREWLKELGFACTRIQSLSDPRLQPRGSTPALSENHSLLLATQSTTHGGAALPASHQAGSQATSATHPGHETKALIVSVGEFSPMERLVRQCLSMAILGRFRLIVSVETPDVDLLPLTAAGVRDFVPLQLPKNLWLKRLQIAFGGTPKLRVADEVTRLPKPFRLRSPVRLISQTGHTLCVETSLRLSKGDQVTLGSQLVKKGEAPLEVVSATECGMSYWLPRRVVLQTKSHKPAIDLVRFEQLTYQVPPERVLFIGSSSPVGRYIAERHEQRNAIMRVLGRIQDMLPQCEKFLPNFIVIDAQCFDLSEQQEIANTIIKLEKNLQSHGQSQSTRKKDLAISDPGPKICHPVWIRSIMNPHHDNLFEGPLPFHGDLIASVFPLQETAMFGNEAALRIKHSDTDRIFRYGHSMTAAWLGYETAVERVSKSGVRLISPIGAEPWSYLFAHAPHSKKGVETTLRALSCITDDQGTYTTEAMILQRQNTREAAPKKVA